MKAAKKLSNISQGTPKNPIIERLGRAGGTLIRLCRGKTADVADATSHDFNELDEAPPIVVDLDSTVNSQEERARAFGMTVEKLDKMESDVYQYISESFAILANEIPYGVISSYISLCLKEGQTEAQSNLVATIISDSDLLDRGVLRCLSNENLAEVMTREEIRGVIEDVRLEAGKVGSVSVTNSVQMNPIVGEKKQEFSIEADLININREEAIDKINKKYEGVVDNWEENKNSLTREQMALYFEREKLDQRFLDTYFDTCQYGLVNKMFVEAAAHFDRRSEDFMSFLETCKKSIVEHFEPKVVGKERDFSPENCAFTRNGTKAFRLFYDNYLKDGDTVLVSSEEYGEMIDMLNGKLKVAQIKHINVVVLPPYADFDSDEEYAETVREKSIVHDADFFLISAVSRRGTVFPLETISRILEDGNESIDMVVDGAQAAGRRMLDFNKIKPAIFISSSQKGTDFGGPVGLLSVSTDFIHRNGNFDYNEGEEDNPYMELGPDDLNHIYDDEIGTLSKIDMARFAMGMNPIRLRSLRDRNGESLPKCLIMSVEEREKANHNLAFNFLELLKEVNSDNEGRIKILYPANVYSENGDIQKRKVSNIFECKIEGLHLTDKDKDGKKIKGKKPGVVEYAAAYGVTIQDYYDEAEGGASFRIAFHPFMSNESIKVLAYALQECCRIAKDREVE